MPAVLQKLARHSSIQTTMSFYVNLNADEIGADLWANHAAAVGNTPAVGNTFGNIAREPRKEKGLKTSPKSFCENTLD
jgi:hypothetical protein